MERNEIADGFFPEGIPRLWCPLISHYREEGIFDKERMSAHVGSLKKYVGAFLAPGSTGDGWEMDSGERVDLIDLLVPILKERGGRLLLGVLETERGAAARQVEALARRYNFDGSNPVCGVTVTAPKGAELSEELIHEELSQVLALGIPTALYQLPQITENEISPSSAARLAEEFSNFYLFKDTGGNDRVAMSGKMPEDLFLVRGAEGDYCRWYHAAGGPYDGFLLSTANGFAAQLWRIIELSEAAEREEGSPAGNTAIAEAREMSDLLSRVVAAAFEIAGSLSFGNPFANANKAVDHWMAFGSRADGQNPPLTHSGNRLPGELIEKTGEYLTGSDLMPVRGYLE